MPGSLGERPAAVFVDVNAATDAIATYVNARQVIPGACCTIRASSVGVAPDVTLVCGRIPVQLPT